MNKMDESLKKSFNTALYLSITTILINVLEGAASVYYGYEDGTITLFGFGIDSLIEVVSALGVYVMIKRIINNPMEEKSRFEITALKITGFGFYILTAGLAVGIFVNIYYGIQPRTTIPGVIISIISIALMIVLIKGKLLIGKKLECSPIISDANCTKVCVYMSLVVLIASSLYEISGIKYIDSLGAIGIIYFSFKEGREAFEKAKGLKTCDFDNH
jgi:divalent metal cation (Fe/Co/Zn/Cd) transporter